MAGSALPSFAGVMVFRTIAQPLDRLFTSSVTDDNRTLFEMLISARADDSAGIISGAEMRSGAAFGTSGVVVCLEQEQMQVQSFWCQLSRGGVAVGG
jgi:hypothetical protein